jgi:pimeloyl-ACP methyl ester carboxylesterase
MKKGWIKKTIKISGFIFIALILVISVLVYRFTKPNTDLQIIEKFEDESFQPVINYIIYKDKKVRVISMQKELDSTLPVLLFVHGSPGSSMDFNRYLKNEELNNRANLITYDRLGYGNMNTGEVLNSVGEEVEVLHQIIDKIDSENIILIGYSYGGTIILASQKKYKKKIALAAAVRGDLEPMFWALNLYKWNLTRPLIPKVLQAASEEKLRHVTELKKYENQWNISESKVLSIHGKLDKIVPFQNSMFLKNIFDKDKFTLLPIENGNHSLIWTDFELINQQILNSLKD